jgi:hypothetical protein
VSVMCLVNHLRNPKQWAIAHENDPKMQKWWVFGHASQTCTECHGPCKSPHNPKIVGNSSQKRAYTQKRWVFGHAYQTSTKCQGLENHPENPKLWTIAHENGLKM